MPKTKTYRIQANRCLGYFVPVVIYGDGTSDRGAEWPTKDDAHAAILYHHKNGHFPSEVEDEIVEVCEACGQPVRKD